jgi:hypothetical protein
VYEELEQIASLEFGKAMETIASQTRENVRDAVGRFAATSAPGIRSGQHEASLVRLRIDGAEQIGRALLQIWVDLVVQRNGHIARADIDFIARKVEHFANAQPAHIRKASAQGRGAIVASVTEEANQRMYALCAGVRRDLEIMAREYEAFPARRQEGKSMADRPRKRYSGGNERNAGL